MREMTVHVGRFETEEDVKRDIFIKDFTDNQERFFFESVELLQSVLNPKALKLLSDIKSGKLYDYSESAKAEIENLVTHGIVEIKDDEYVFEYSAINFDFTVQI